MAFNSSINFKTTFMMDDDRFTLLVYYTKPDTIIDKSELTD